MIAQRRPTNSGCDIKVYSDKGSLALRFPVRHKVLLEVVMGKGTKAPNVCLALGKYGFSDNPENRKRAELLASQIEADLDHRDWKLLFDPTFAKYGICDFKSALSNLSAVPTPPPKATTQMSVGKMWELHLAQKVKQLQPTTYHLKFEGSYTKALEGVPGLMDCAIDSTDLSQLMSQLTINKTDYPKLLSTLVEAFTNLQVTGKITLSKNPFAAFKGVFKGDVREQYKPVTTATGDQVPWYVEIDKKSEIDSDNDYRAFTKEQRDFIINAFYNSDKPAKRSIAPFVHFLFLTGCRPGEASALEWGNVNFDTNILWFSKSYNGDLKNIQRTKTGEVRTFKMYPALRELLLSIKPADAKPSSVVFTTTTGSRISQGNLRDHWQASSSGSSKSGKKYYVPGVVSELVEQGILPFYLSAYHTRHTYITLTANANKDDNQALLHIASACGNSVDVIIKHYLGVTEKPEIKHV